MTRQALNNIILTAFQQEIADTPGLDERIASAYSTWVQNLIAAGQAELTPQPVNPTSPAPAAAEESQQPAQESVPIEEGASV